MARFQGTRDPEISEALKRQKQLNENIKARSGEIMDAATVRQADAAEAQKNRAVMSALQRGGGVGAAGQQAEMAAARNAAMARAALTPELLSRLQAGIGQQAAIAGAGAQNLQQQGQLGLQYAGLEQQGQQFGASLGQRQREFEGSQELARKQLQQQGRQFGAQHQLARSAQNLQYKQALMQARRTSPAQRASQIAGGVGVPGVSSPAGGGGRAGIFQGMPTRHGTVFG